MNSPEISSLVPSEAICAGMAYFTSINEASTVPSLLAYLRIMERAWDDFDLNGVLCVDNIPSVYFKEVPVPLSDEELNDLHRRFWNQGVAQTFVVADPKTVRIFSGLAKPQKPEIALTKESSSLVETLSSKEFAKKISSICLAISNGSWYKRHASHYKSDSSVDTYLLANLVDLHNQLTKTSKKEFLLEAQTANALIGRVLFVCYLVDRKIYALPGDLANKSLNHAIKEIPDENDAINFLYDLFEKLKDKFNGSMFDQDLCKEKGQIKPFHIEQIRDFLDGHEIGTSQRNLGFWAYDFKLIPVETISAIYEEFLAHEDPERKRETGAFYTPRFLAELTIDVAVEGRDDWHTLRYLDPCCGSGIFLVTLFNRLATKWWLDNPGCDSEFDGYLKKVEALREILSHNIRGIDLHSTACHLACFSLYIAFLDCLRPSDIWTYMEKTNCKLPRLLADADTNPGPDYIPVIRRANFLEDNGLTSESIDCVIGNPPWEGRSSKQIAIHILEHAERYIKCNGEGCLLLPSKVFLNSQTNDFQARWLKRVTIERVVQLADYRFALFEQAVCPAMIVRYRKGAIDDPLHQIAYDTPKFQPSARRRGLITIGSQDHKWLSQSQLIEATLNNRANIIWKRAFWGSIRDIRLISYLESLPSLSLLTGVPGSNARWSRGKGFEPDTKKHCRTTHSPWWNDKMLYLS
ncbi:MAG TPA: N-6 DNA methylase, partial [Geobacteraceae bacterium]